MPIRAQLFDGTVLEFPDGTDQSVVDRVARQETLKRQPQPEAAPAPIEPPKKEGFGAAFGKGIEGILSPSRTAIGALTGSPEEAALAGLKRAEASPYAEQVSLDKVKKAYERGLLPAAGEVLRQIPLAITEQAPNIAATLGSARLGAMAGAGLGSIVPGIGTAVGTIGGGIVGAVAPSLLQQFGGNIQRQAQEQLEAKKPVDISRTAAIAAAVPQAGLDVAATLIPLGRTVAGSVLGPQVKQLLERGAKESAEKLARESLPTVLAKGAGISIASEAPTEAVQSMLERAQAGLPLLSEDALKEYGEAAYQAALIAPIGAAARVGERSAARQEARPPELRPGETDRQAAERIQAEILAMKQAANPPAPAPGPILNTNNLYNLIAQPNGYGLVEQYKQRLMALPEQTPEVKQAIEDASFIQRRSVIEAAERRTTKPAPEETVQPKGPDAGEAITPPSGEGAQVAGKPDTGAATEGARAAQPSGVVSPVADVGQPSTGEGSKPAAVKPQVEALQGSETRLILPDGEKRSANWEVIEADSVSAAMFEGRAQPRDRQRAASNAQVLAIANNPDFDRLSDTSQTLDYGAPTLTGEYVIVGGNGRFEGINLSYDTEVGQTYKQNLISNAQRFGLDPAQVSGMKKPVLIRKISGESVKPDDTRKLAIQSNIAPGLEMSDMERAALDSERMTNLQELDITDTGDIPLTTKNMGTIRDALKGYTKEELSGMLAADGSLSQSGLRRVKNAVLYKAYGKTDTLARLLESPDADLKNVGTALMRASGSMSRLMDGIRSGAIPADYDIIADLTGAVETLSALRASGTKVQDFISQSDMFGGGISNEAKTILTFLDQNLRSAKSITEFLNDYANAAISAESAGDGLFGEVQLPSKQETIERAAQRPEAERAAAKSQQTIFEQPAGAPSEEGAAKPEGAERPLEGGEGAVAKKSLVEMRKRYEAARAAPAPVETKPEPTALDKEIEAKIEELGRVLSRIMGRFGLKDVALKLVEDMKAEGEYAQSVIRLALDAASPVQALRHESIHALKELGFFTPQQWAVLEKQARSKWIDQYLKNVNINKEPLFPGEKSRYDAYSDLFKSQGLSDAAIEEAIREEAIADAFGDFDVNKAPPGMMQAILTRLRNFFDAVKTAFGGEITAEQVFRKVEKGELKAEAALATKGEPKSSLRVIDMTERRARQLVEEENAETRQMLDDRANWQRGRDLETLKDKIYPWLKEHMYAVDKARRVYSEAGVIPGIQAREISGSISSALDKFEYIAKNAYTGVYGEVRFYGPPSETNAFTGTRYAENALDSDGKEIVETVNDYLKAVEEYRGRLNNRSSRQREMKKALAEILDNVVVGKFAKPSLRAPQTEAFKKWFGNSKVVDENGDPLVVYHGSNAEFDIFDTEEGAFFFGGKGAKSFAETYGDNITPVYLSIKKPFKGTYEDLAGADFDVLAKNGYDGAVFVDKESGLQQWVAFKPTQIKSVTGNIGTFDSTKPDIRYSLRQVPLSTRGLMEVQPIVAMQELGLKTDAVRKPGGIELFNDVRSIALALNQDTIRNHGQIAKTDTSLTSEKELARAMVDEIGYQLRATADTGTGKGWYSDNYPKAVKKLGKLFPELETDPYARTVFSALVAITSNGEKVSLNVKNAIKLYEDIRMGKDPRGIGSRRQKALDNNLAVVLQLMKQYGPTGMRNELLREITVKDMNAILRSRGEKPDTSYLADTKVPAAALYFGPKLGAFFSNLEGAEGYLTMDMWWTRTVNRMRGQLESKATEASIKKFANMMDKPNATREEVVAATIPLRNKYEEFGWHTELEELVGKKEPAEDKDKPAWTAKAKRKAGPAYEALLFEHRLEKMANTIYKNEYELLEEAPFTSTDREFMYRTARRAQSLLKAEGINLSLADIQAALWYYEKRLYQHLSGRKADDIGYDEAITQLARESTGPARPSVVFGGQPVPGTGPAGAGAAATGVSGKPAKPSLRSTSAAEAFDQKEIDNLRRPDYKGREKLIEMPISDFLNLADDETDTQKLNVARQRLAQGKQFTTLPYLQVGIDYRVDGHEGRHRAKALMEKGYTSMPVILRMGGLRWDQQNDPNSFDYVKDWPQTLQAQSKAENPDLLVPFPVAREDSVKPYTAPMPKFSLRASVPRDIHNRIVQTTVAREEKGFVRRITEAISPQSFASFRAAALNRYNQLSVYDKRLAAQMGGTALLADSSAEAAALLSDLGAGLTASALGVHDRMGGVPVYKNGITTISNLNNTVKGPTAIFAPLAKYNDPYAYQAYQFWAGVKRGSRFMADGREQLFEPADIQRAEALRKQFLRDGVDFDAIQKEWIKYNNGLVDYMVDTGVLSKDRADLYKKHADYLPFYRQMDGEETVGPKIFQAISGVKPPKKLKGGPTAIDDFLENIVRNTQAAIQAGVKNVAAQRAADVAMKINMATRLPYQSSGPTTFQVLENGKVVTYASNDMLFINAIKSLGLPDLPFIGMLSAPANLLRNLVTKDPGFMLANLMRDSMSAWVTSGVKMTPMVDTISNFGSALAGKNPAFQALMNAGILGGYEFSQNVEQSGREFGKALRKQAGVKAPGYKGVLEMGAKPFTSLWEALEKGTTASDAATRMEVYKKTLAETGNEAEALYRALEVMNFNRKGSSAVIRVLTAAVPFLNARMQGLDVLYRAASGKMNAADAKEVQRRFFVRGATIMALSAAYWLLTHDDDEYKKQEQETRDNYWLLPSLGVKIPIPFEIGVLFKVIPERILAYTFGSDTGEDFIKSMARQLSSTLAFNPIPQTALPVVEAMTNFSFFTMRPIVGQGLEGVQPAYQVGPGTSRLAEAIGSATKGLATELQISPMKLDQLINGYTGTIGMYLVNLMDAVYDMNTDSPKPSMRFERMPLIRRFALDPEARGSVTAYYELKNSVDSIVRTSNMLERTMNYEELPGYLQDNMRMLAAKDYLLDLEKTMKEFREMKVMIRSSKMEADAKRDSILSIDKMENQLTANIQYLKSLAKGG